MKIYTKKGERGDGLHEMTYIDRVRPNGDSVPDLLMNTVVSLLAITDDGEKYLLAVGDARTLDCKLVDVKDMVEPKGIKKIIRPFGFYGSSRDWEFYLNFLRVNYMDQFKCRLIAVENVVGRYIDADNEFWILDRMIIFKKLADKFYCNTEIKKLANGLEAINYDKKITFKIGRVWYHIENTEVPKELRPMADFSVNDDYSRFREDKLLETWVRQYNNPVLNLMVLGWFIGVIYSEEVRHILNTDFYPYFGVSGLTQSGKTSLIGNYFRFFGLRVKPTDYTQTSQFVEVKTLGMVSNIPIWRDEYRENVGHSKVKESLLRSMYAKSSLQKGTSGQEMKNYYSKTTLFLSGEDMIMDTATRRRCIYFVLQDNWKVDRSVWEEVKSNAEKDFPHMFLYVIKSEFDAVTFALLYEKAVEQLSTVNEVREEAVVIACLGAIFGMETGEMLIGQANLFWQTHRLIRPNVGGIKSLGMQFFDHMESFLYEVGAFELKNSAYFEDYAPSVFKLIIWDEKEEVFWVNIPMLVGVAYEKAKMASVTTINRVACEQAIQAMIGHQVYSKKVMKRYWKATRIDPDDTAKYGEGFNSILTAVKLAYDVWRARSQTMMYDDIISDLNYKPGGLVGFNESNLLS